MAARLINSLLLVCLGVVFGLVGTVAHQSTATIGGITIAWGVIVSLLGIACLLAGVRLITTDRWSALFVAVGVLIPIAVLSFKSAGGSVLIPDNLLGKVWVIAPAIIAAIVVAWPTISRRPVHA
jgi:hypothetical protein